MKKSVCFLKIIVSSLSSISRIIIKSNLLNIQINGKCHYLVYELYSIIYTVYFIQYLINDFSDHMRALAESASSFSYSNIAESKIMKNQAWGLLNTQAVFSSVIPGTKLTGAMSGMVQFPSELGKISTTNKNARLAG